MRACRRYLGVGRGGRSLCTRFCVWRRRRRRRRRRLGCHRREPAHLPLTDGEDGWKCPSSAAEKHAQEEEVPVAEGRRSRKFVWMYQTPLRTDLRSPSACITSELTTLYNVSSRIFQFFQCLIKVFAMKICNSKSFQYCLINILIQENKISKCKYTNTPRSEL